MRVRVMAVTVGLVLLAAACGSSGTPEAASTTTTQPATTTSTEKPQETRRNKEPIAYEDVVELSLVDIQGFWEEQLPEFYDLEYTPLDDGDIYAGTSDDPPPACTPEGGQGTYADIEGNAFYCPLDGGYVAYDDETLFPELYEQFGEYAVAMVMAHEWGHVIQDQVGIIDEYQTILIENQADCFAGAWTKHSLATESEVGFRAEPKDLQSALGGMLKFSDAPGADIFDNSAHGSGFDRINGFRLGFDEGVGRCAEFPDNPPPIQNIPFTSTDDAATGGNLPYEEAIQLATTDLNAYWTALAGDAGFDFEPVENVVRFSAETAMPECGGKQYTEDEALKKIFFCVDDNYVAWDDIYFEEINAEIGDFGLGVLIAQQWSVSAQIQDGLDKDVIESKEGRLQQSCFTGAWAFAVLNGDAHNGGAMSLSPGDLDEAILAFLAFSDTPDDEGETEQGSAFEQAGAFSDGFFFGEKQCAQMNL